MIKMVWEQLQKLVNEMVEELKMYVNMSAFIATKK